MIRVGVIGYGYWGPNLVRNFMGAPGATVAAVSDLRAERLTEIHARYPGVKTTTNHAEVFADASIDAVVIATPVSTHFNLGMQALAAGKHVLIEKPMTASTKDAERLIETAQRRNLVLMVDHTFVYTGAVRKMRELLDAGRLGQLYYYDSVRVNLGLFQHDVNVLWDLAVHDLAIMDHLIVEKPVAVAVSGMAHLPGHPANIAYLTCFFESNFIAHLHVNWLAPVKVRRTLLGGTGQMIVYDDLEPDEKIKVYDKGVSSPKSEEQMHQLMVNYRAGDMWAPRLERAEALSVEAAHFLDCIRSGTTPLTDGEAGLRVVKILEAADQSLASGGRPVSLQPARGARRRKRVKESGR